MIGHGGWNHLVRAAFTLLLPEQCEGNARPCRVTQVKERLGRLVIHHVGQTDFRRGIRQLLERISETTCIMCGQPGRRHETGWIHPGCDACKANERPGGNGCCDRSPSCSWELGLVDDARAASRRLPRALLWTLAPPVSAHVTRWQTRAAIVYMESHRGRCIDPYKAAGCWVWALPRHPVNELRGSVAGTCWCRRCTATPAFEGSDAEGRRRWRN